MANFICLAAVLIIIGAAIAYIVKEKKRGVRCIGCPAAGTCSSHNHGEASGCSGSCEGNTCGCHADTE